MKRNLCSVAGFLLALFVSAAPAAAQPSPWQMHWSARFAALEAHTAVVGQGRTLIFSDSNYERFWWNTVDGCMILNAGFGGASIHDLANLAPQVAALTRPSHVFIGGGTNSIGLSHSDPQWASLATDIQRSINAFRAVGSNIILEYVPPVDASRAAELPAANRDHINALILSAGSANNINVDWWWASPSPAGSGLLTGANGYALPGVNIADGIHWSGATTVKRYHEFDRMLDWAVGHYQRPC